MLLYITKQFIGCFYHLRGTANAVMKAYRHHPAFMQRLLVQLIKLHLYLVQELICRKPLTGYQLNIITP